MKGIFKSINASSYIAYTVEETKKKKNLTFLGENTPSVPPSSLIATPISASKASLKNRKRHNETNALAQWFSNVFALGPTF